MLERTQINGHDYIVTEGGCVDRCGKIAGLFNTEADAMADNADEVAAGSVGWDTLTQEQQQMATRNSERAAFEKMTPEEALDWWGLECVDYEKEEMR